MSSGERAPGGGYERDPTRSQPRDDPFAAQARDERAARDAPAIGNRALDAAGVRPPDRVDPQDERVKHVGERAVRAARDAPPERQALDREAPAREAPRDDRERT